MENVSNSPIQWSRALWPWALIPLISGLVAIISVKAVFLVLAMLCLMFILRYFHISMTELLVSLIILAQLLRSHISNYASAFFLLIIFFTLFVYMFKIKVYSVSSVNSFLKNVISLMLFSAAAWSILSIIYNSAFTLHSAFESFRLLISWVTFLAFCFLIDSKVKVKRVLILSIIASILIGIYGYLVLYNMGLISFVIHGIGALRGAKGWTSNTNAIAYLIAFPFPVLISYILFGGTRRYKQASFAILTAFFPIWLLLNARSTYLFLIIAMFVLMLLHKRRWLMITTFSALILVGVIVLVNIPIISDLLRIEDGVTYRTEIWAAAIEMVRESPVFGKGPGAFDKIKYYYMDIYTRAIFGAKQEFSSHNLFLLRASELGLMGAISVIIFWIASIIAIIKSVKIVRGTDLFPFFAGCSAIFVGMIFRSFFESGGNYLGFMALAIILNAPLLTGRDKIQKSL